MKIIELWLTKAEYGDEALQSRLLPLYAQWKAEKYRVAVFRSGTKSLRDQTAALLLHDQKVFAQQAAARKRERLW